MNYYKLVLPVEAGYSFVRAFAGRDMLMLEDENKAAISKPFASSVKRVEDLLAKVASIEEQMAAAGVQAVLPESYQDLEPEIEARLARLQDPSKYLDRVEEELNSIFGKIQTLVQNKDTLLAKLRRALEFKEVLARGRETIGYSNKLLDVGHDRSYLSTIAGLIDSAELQRFTKLLFRLSKGNCWSTAFPMPQYPDYPLSRSVFLLVFQSGEHSALRNKITRLCESFSTDLFTVPLLMEDYTRQIQDTDSLVTECRHLLSVNMVEIEETLRDLAALLSPEAPFSLVSYYRVFLLSENYVYQELNKFELVRNVLSGSFWAPAEEENELYSALGVLQRARMSSTNAKFYRAETEAAPPTHFATNEFTAVFQEIVNTYGIPRYQEVNPGIFAVPFFPFLFGIMFGDIGHGGALLAAGIYLCQRDEEVRRSPLKAVSPYRYLFLLMGVFALFSGFIYNDFLSLPWNIFGSCYENDPHEGVAHLTPGCVYPLGFDPKWYRAENELAFFNSFKMKLAVIIGVLQMSIGIFLKMLNTVHFGLWTDFVFEWLPQQTFMFATFGYMCLMIFKKWTLPWGLEAQYDLSMAPSIINQMIDLPLNLGSTGGKPLWTVEGQEALQLLLLQVALLMVPIMLLPKPFYLLVKHRSIVPSKAPHDEEDLAEELRESFITDESNELRAHHRRKQAAAAGPQHEEFEFGEVFVHQIIETIEFVLGSISNTASYLRLWALSLAHSQLAKVFFEKTVGGSIESGSFLGLVLGWVIFINVTFGVIMCMDMMECFLHALRLQWVEFQSKFFKADGWKFVPASTAQFVNLKSAAQ